MTKRDHAAEYRIKRERAQLLGCASVKEYESIPRAEREARLAALGVKCRKSPPRSKKTPAAEYAALGLFEYGMLAAFGAACIGAGIWLFRAKGA